MKSEIEFASPYFLGPAAENAHLLEELVVEFLRDHAFWRRNFHPEDGQRIREAAHHEPHFLDCAARIREELYSLSADLKRSVPFYNPRYVGHMAADLLLPGLVAKLITTLYNPNNVAEEGATVTLDKELEVGEQLARMLGYAVDDRREPCAWGHLTSGGTVANYEALWNFRSVKFYGIALRQGCLAQGFDPEGVGPAAKRLSEYSPWELVNLSIDETIALRRAVMSMAERLSREGAYELSRAVRRERIESRGTAEFLIAHPQIPPPKVLIASSAHYSWEKGMKVLGFGTSHLVRVAVDDHMRLDVDHLAECLERELEAEVPILAVIGVLGTTEFGTVDPIHGIVAERERWRAIGCDFGIHVDAAWGGYLASVFRRADGSLEEREAIGKEFEYFPSPTIYEAFRAIPETDSVTIDPHKLGYVPYAAGAFVARNREVVDFITQDAAYVFDVEEDPEDASRTESPRRAKLHDLGRYILEGSKPGASAAAVHVTHAVLPLHREGMGRLLELTIRAGEAFYDSARAISDRLSGVVRVCVPFEPDSNLITIAVNPAGNDRVAVMNRFSRRVFARMQVDPARPVQVKQFIGSHTSLLKESLPGDQARRILEELRLDPTTFVAVPRDDDREAEHLFILRHTLMNPWLLAGPRERTYIDLYWDFFEEVVTDVLNEMAA